MKFVIEVREVDSQADKTHLETEDFREALASYESLKKILANKLDTCSFDIVIMYVRADAVTPCGDLVPVVMSMVETNVAEY